MFDFKILELADIKYLSDLFYKDGLIQPVPYSILKEFPHSHLQQWCVENAVYQIPTTELIDWLKENIDENTLEIGAGNNCIGHMLGIKSTDNYMQTRPEIINYYRLLKQKTTAPQSFVENIDANEAVVKYKPSTVLALYVTNRHVEGDAKGNMFGPIEEEIVSRARYIHVGNEETHNSKKILKLPHRSYKFPWLISRSVDQSKNVIWVWEKQ